MREPLDFGEQEGLCDGAVGTRGMVGTGSNPIMAGRVEMNTRSSWGDERRNSSLYSRSRRGLFNLRRAPNVRVERHFL